MSNEENSFSKNFIENLESGIEKLPQDTKEKLFSKCAERCVKDYVLVQQKKIFDECNKDYDLMCEKLKRTDYFFADIIERGHIYEIGYPKCFCQVVQDGLTSLPVYCECSKQSILYVLKTLMPEKDIKVEVMHTILSGADECRFRVIIE